MTNHVYTTEEMAHFLFSIRNMLYEPPRRWLGRIAYKNRQNQIWRRINKKVHTCMLEDEPFKALEDEYISEELV